MTARTLSSKGRQTRQALEDAARRLFAERGFHRTTLADITAAAGRSPAAFYRYFTDKEDLLATLAEDFLNAVLRDAADQSLRDAADQSQLRGQEPQFTAAVGAYWRMFKPNIGILVAVDQLAATDPRFALVQNRFRRFGMDIVGASVARAQRRGYATGLNARHISLAIALLFERFTSVALGEGLSDDEAVATLSVIWTNTLYCNSKET